MPTPSTILKIYQRHEAHIDAIAREAAAAHAAVCLSQRPEFTGKTIAILFPDGAAANFYPHPTVNCPASAR